MRRRLGLSGCVRAKPSTERAIGPLPFVAAAGSLRCGRGRGPRGLWVLLPPRAHWCSHEAKQSQVHQDNTVIFLGARFAHKPTKKAKSGAFFLSPPP